ncbi:hypothetical protein EIP86_002262 [Pleurotus ostreatoroseus]|nr:hypothetical protein EIP86_002262 [Pleurotus ostreatoroseus]
MERDQKIVVGHLPKTPVDLSATRQTYDAFLVLDVEATCQLGTDFNYANEIIASHLITILSSSLSDSCTLSFRNGLLEKVDEFRSFVKPVWRPQLSSFCTKLTGITQDNVNQAPTFATLVHTTFREFLVRNGLIDPITNEPLVRFCWCSDGPWDIRDFVVKQCFISKIALPRWISGDVMDVRRVVARWQEKRDARSRSNGSAQASGTFLPLTRQLHVLGLGLFEGRQHCGMDDTRNVARIVVELARRGMPLRPNTSINPNRRWPWMGRNGKILEELVAPASASL